MALPASGQIALSNIQTEFGGVNPISLNEYYRNGTYVIGTGAPNVPTSGVISLSQFYGQALVTTDLTPDAWTLTKSFAKGGFIGGSNWFWFCTWGGAGVIIGGMSANTLVNITLTASTTVSTSLYINGVSVGAANITVGPLSTSATTNASGQITVYLKQGGTGSASSMITPINSGNLTIGTVTQGYA